MSLTIGDKAPSFALKDKDGIIHALAKVKSPYVIVYFYPKDDTPGCTIEAQTFTKDLARFEKSGVAIIGISGGNEESKKKFCSKYGLKVLLLSDTDFSVAKKYGVYIKKSFMGRSFMGIARTTFVLDKSHNIIKVFEKVDPKTHAPEILNFISNIKR